MANCVNTFLNQQVENQKQVSTLAWGKLFKSLAIPLQIVNRRQVAQRKDVIIKLLGASLSQLAFDFYGRIGTKKLTTLIARKTWRQKSGRKPPLWPRRQIGA